MNRQTWRIETWALRDWVSYAWELERVPRGGAPIDRRVARHLSLFPIERIRDELDRSVLVSVQSLVKQGSGARFGRPNRGARGRHPTTPILMAVNNQLARLPQDRANANFALGDEP